MKFPDRRGQKLEDWVAEHQTDWYRRPGGYRRYRPRRLLYTRVGPLIFTSVVVENNRGEETQVSWSDLRRMILTSTD